MRSGNVNPANTTGTFRNAGYGSLWWSSRTAASVSDAYDLYFNITVNPSDIPDHRWGAFPLRCLSTVLGM